MALEAKRKPVAQPTAKLPGAWSQPPAEGGSLEEWWKQFGDPQLTQLIETALAANPDGALARARLVESRAVVTEKKAGFWPSGTPSLSYTDSTRSNNSPAIPKLGGGGGFGGGGADLIPRRYSVYQTSFDSSYEFDLFGGQRRTLDANRADAAAQQEDLRDTLISLTAEVARDYLDYREAEVRAGLQRDSIANLEVALELTRMRVRGGLANGQDELRLESQLATARASLPSLEAKREQTLYALAQLTGERAEELGKRLSTGKGLPALPDQAPAGAPSDLLKRRPDVRKALAQLNAAGARRQSAETEWWPKIKLTSNVGGQSGDFTNLLAGGSILSSLAPQISWGAVNWRKTRATIRQQEAREAQQVAQADKTILAAFKDVEVALSAIERERQRQVELRRAVDVQGQQVDLARKLERAGLSTNLPVLEAERNQISAIDQEVQSRAAVRRSLVTLYKALGGGWEAMLGAQ